MSGQFQKRHLYEDCWKNQRIVTTFDCLFGAPVLVLPCLLRAILQWTSDPAKSGAGRLVIYSTLKYVKVSNCFHQQSDDCFTCFQGLYGGFLKWGYPQSSSIWIGFFHEINYQSWGTPMYGNLHMLKTIEKPEGIHGATQNSEAPLGPTRWGWWFSSVHGGDVEPVPWAGGFTHQAKLSSVLEKRSSTLPAG